MISVYKGEILPRGVYTLHLDKVQSSSNQHGFCLYWFFSVQGGPRHGAQFVYCTPPYASNRNKTGMVLAGFGLLLDQFSEFDERSLIGKTLLADIAPAKSAAGTYNKVLAIAPDAVRKKVDELKADLFDGDRPAELAAANGDRRSGSGQPGGVAPAARDVDAGAGGKKRW
jgi:hypothetical protein